MALAGRPVLALVPARGGSKGVLRKNLRLLAGLPLVHWTLIAAKAATAVDAIYLSSDDPDILACARECDAIPISRPEAASSDSAPAAAVVEHFLSTLPPDLVARDPYIVYLQPTSPCRTSRHIDESLAAMAAGGAHTMLSVYELSKPPFKIFGLDEDGRLKSLFDEALTNARRQDLPRTFYPNGAIYAFRVSDFKERSGFPSNGGVPYLMSETDSIDIDTEADLQQAEQILESKRG